MQRAKWTDRKFNLDLPVGWLPDVIERLYGTEFRLKAMIEGLSESALSDKKQNAWSIKEHIGHLIDLEDLHEGRIDDLKDRKEILRAADMSNAKTNTADHNQREVQQLLREFITKRKAFISRLRSLDDETQLFASLHPRLKVMMRPVDLAFFTAEHDDHHLASIREILNEVSN